jgi:MFS family permease
LVMLVVETIGYLVLGRLADRFGHKLSVEIGVL